MTFHRFLTGAVTALTLMLAPAAHADNHAFKSMWPGGAYDPSVPTLESVIGHATGEKITLPENAIRYLETLAAQYPDRVKLYDYGKSWEGRRLVYVAVSSAENIARLDDIKAGMAALADPAGTSDAEADTLINSLPANVWLSYGVHGNEISSTDASLAVLHHLLASENDPRVAEMMEKTVVLLAPMQNPDGRARFIHRYRMSVGLEPDSDPLSAEQNEPWPSGRTNHYLFDMNRDWIALTQPEIRSQVAVVREWRPQVFVDLHEMGGNSSYYFAPEADPFNPHLMPAQRENLFLFGRTNARWFDEFGLSYFTRDVFDAFYPGYGASWPAYQGAISMTYEQGSSRGLKYRRADGSEFTYRDSIMGHFTTSLGTIETTATNREKLLRDFRAYHVTAVEEGEKERGKKFYVFPGDQRDGAGAAKLAGNLAAMGVNVTRTTAAGKACGADLAPGSFVISSAQTSKRLLRTLLDPQVDMDAAWVAEQERRRAKDIDHDIYDVTAWSLPKMYNLDMDRCDRVTFSGGETVGEYETPKGSLTGDADAVVYLVPWGDMAAGRFMTAALRKGLVMKTHNDGFTIKGRAYPRGTLIIEAGKNSPDVRPLIEQLAETSGADVIASDTTWVDAGRDLGGRSVQPVYPVKIAMLWDDPTSQYSAGNTRFVIERQMNYPVSVIRANRLRRADLSRYQVLILPDAWGGYMSALGKQGAETIRNWVQAGGVLVAQARAMRFVTHEDVGLLSTSRENQPAPERKDEGNPLIGDRNELLDRIQPAQEGPDSVPGVLVYGDIEPDHFLSAGVADTLNILVRGSDIYSPVALDAGTNVVSFKGPDALLSSGYLWDENRKQLAYKPFVIAERRGRGMVIGFTQDPTVRAYLDGLNVLYMNALFRAPGQARPVR